jgi:hypothetical protein
MYFDRQNTSIVRELSLDTLVLTHATNKPAQAMESRYVAIL